MSILIFALFEDKQKNNNKKPEKQHVKRTFLTKNFNLFQQVTFESS